LGDSTINYTVRIWSTDSCSVVKPVRVRVLPQPNFESIDVSESICGFESGSIAGASTGLSLPHSYQINNSAPQNNFSFSNLSAGQYTLTVTDANGCSRDSTVQINEINNVQAAFTVNPSSGAAPLQVQTQNNSQNATQYEWFWSEQSSSAFSPSILLDTAGVYTLTLVASNGAAQCNDTATALIFVEEPFVVFAYTFLTDEVNVYQIFLSGVSEYRYDLYALDGKLVYQQSGNMEAAGYVDLWEISGVASGMYVFRVRVKDNAGNEQEVDGKVVVVR
jgi:PKD repeat protein